MNNTGNRFHWTIEQKELMCSLYAEGYSCKDIAFQLGATDGRLIRYHLLKIGVKLRGVGMMTEIARAKSSNENHHNWKGGRRLDHGYWTILNPEHPHADNCGHIREHRYVVEQHLLATNPTHPAIKNGVLDKTWMAHHINGDKQDNRTENLEVMPRSKHHSWMHYQDEMDRLREENRTLKELLCTNGIDF